MLPVIVFFKVFYGKITEVKSHISYRNCTVAEKWKNENLTLISTDEDYSGWLYFILLTGAASSFDIVRIYQHVFCNVCLTLQTWIQNCSHCTTMMHWCEMVLRSLLTLASMHRTFLYPAPQLYEHYTLCRDIHFLIREKCTCW